MAGISTKYFADPEAKKYVYVPPNQRPKQSKGHLEHKVYGTSRTGVRGFGAGESKPK